MSRAHALTIFKAALKAADPLQAVLRHVRVSGDGVLIAGRQRYKLASVDRIFVIGAGKAGAAMGQAIEKLLGKRIVRGLINVKYGHTTPLRRIELHECGHPIPDQSGLSGAEQITGIAQEAGERDLVICLISGGASALLPLPVHPVSLEDKQRLTGLLLECGANIGEMNCLRKHLSRVKGGHLARLAFPARVLTLILSDVIGDYLDVIGSGPTVPDPSTLAGARQILTKYALRDRVPKSIAGYLQGGAAQETPKPGDPAFDRVQNLIVGSNRLAVNAAAARARELGYRTLVLSTLIAGETREIAGMHAAIALEVRASGQPVKAPACLISGGETTVTIRGQGLGGRNQEFALAAGIEIRGTPGITILSAGTDGTDGPTDAAGAIVDGATVDQAERLGLNAAEFLTANDSYHFFEPLGALVKTGPTNTNVADVRIMLIQAPKR